MHVRACIHAWEGRFRGNNGAESVHVTERIWGWTVYTDINDNESWHTAKLPPREKTIVRAGCVCV